MTRVTALHLVRTDVADVWTRPQQADLDEYADQADLDEQDSARATQVVRAEPVLMTGRDARWAHVVAPWQPSSLDPRGYPGWVRVTDVAPDPVLVLPQPPRPAIPWSGEALLEEARAHLGTAYVWGGTSPGALDCSGLVHLAARSLGVVVPRDAHDQQAVTTPVALGAETAGDLYFFARADEPAHHVGLVVRPGVMLHAPQRGAVVVEEGLDDDRRATLTAVGRLEAAV